MPSLDPSKQQTTAYAWYALALLMFVYILNFLDRTIIYILFPLIKKEMDFSDTQLALLGTTSFAIFYTVLGIPFGRLADKGSRTKIIAGGVVVWSVFSGFTAFAGGFWTIFFCRVMVGVGEATLGPLALFGGAIADRFRQRRRGGRMFYGAVLSLVSVPFWLLLIFTDNVYLILPANFVLLAAALGWLGAAAADVTEIAGVNLRGLGIAVYFFSVNIAAYLIGSNLIGYLNDRFGAAADPVMMRYALLVCPAACVVSVICLFAGGRSLERDTEESSQNS